MKKYIQIVVLLLSLQFWAQNSPKFGISSLDMAKMQLNQNHVYYNPQKGFESCKKAAEEDANPQAMNILAILYSDGLGTNPNQQQALYWFTKAAEAGYQNAWFNAGTMHRNGLGTTQNFKKAFEYYTKGAASKTANSMFGKGYMLYKGLGCKQNYNEAFELFKESSKSGVTSSMYLLGICYRNGYGTPKNLVAAKEWLTKAANYGYKPAQNEMMEAQPELVEYKETQNTYSKTTEIHQKTIDQTFKTVQHQLKKPQEINGTYTGYLITYDWSGQHIIAKDKLTLDLKTQTDGSFTGTWTENNKTPLDLKGTITPTEVLFDNVAYTKIDHYSAKKPTEFLFKEARLQNIVYDNANYLAGNIQLWSARLNEPEKPMYISLVKTNKTTAEETKTLAPTDNFVVYPNPFGNSFSFNLSLKEQSTVDIALYATTGALLYTQKLALPPGNHTHTITVNVPSGAYLLKVNYENNQKTTLVIKS
jgi:hypothetical protein